MRTTLNLQGRVAGHMEGVPTRKKGEDTYFLSLEYFLSFGQLPWTGQREGSGSPDPEKLEFTPIRAQPVRAGLWESVSTQGIQRTERWVEGGLLAPDGAHLECGQL